MVEKIFLLFLTFLNIVNGLKEIKIHKIHIINKFLYKKFINRIRYKNKNKKTNNYIGKLRKEIFDLKNLNIFLKNNLKKYEKEVLFLNENCKKYEKSFSLLGIKNFEDVEIEVKILLKKINESFIQQIKEKKNEIKNEKSLLEKSREEIIEKNFDIHYFLNLKDKNFRRIIELEETINRMQEDTNKIINNKD